MNTAERRLCAGVGLSGVHSATGIGIEAVRMAESGPSYSGAVQGADAVAEIDLRRSLPHVRQELRRRAPYARRVTSGSSALAWSHLAAGRRDLFLHAGQKVWDYAAGALIAEEAGVSLATLREDDFWSGPPWKRSVIAARTPALFAEWRDWVRARL